MSDYNEKCSNVTQYFVNRSRKNLTNDEDDDDVVISSSSHILPPPFFLSKISKKLKNCQRYEKYSNVTHTAGGCRLQNLERS